MATFFQIARDACVYDQKTREAFETVKADTNRDLPPGDRMIQKWRSIRRAAQFYCDLRRGRVDRAIFLGEAPGAMAVACCEDYFDGRWPARRQSGVYATHDSPTVANNHPGVNWYRHVIPSALPAALRRVIKLPGTLIVCDAAISGRGNDSAEFTLAKLKWIARYCRNPPAQAGQPPAPVQHHVTVVKVQDPFHPDVLSHIISRPGHFICAGPAKAADEIYIVGYRDDQLLRPQWNGQYTKLQQLYRPKADLIARAIGYGVPTDSDDVRYRALRAAVPDSSVVVVTPNAVFSVLKHFVPQTDGVTYHLLLPSRLVEMFKTSTTANNTLVRHAVGCDETRIADRFAASHWIIAVEDKQWSNQLQQFGLQDYAAARVAGAQYLAVRTAGHTTDGTELASGVWDVTQATYFLSDSKPLPTTDKGSPAFLQLREIVPHLWLRPGPSNEHDYARLLRYWLERQASELAMGPDGGFALDAFGCARMTNPRIYHWQPRVVPRDAQRTLTWGSTDTVRDRTGRFDFTASLARMVRTRPQGLRFHAAYVTDCLSWLKPETLVRLALTTTTQRVYTVHYAVADEGKGEDVKWSTHHGMRTFEADGGQTVWEPDAQWCNEEDDFVVNVGTGLHRDMWVLSSSVLTVKNYQQLKVWTIRRGTVGSRRLRETDRFWAAVDKHYGHQRYGLPDTDEYYHPGRVASFGAIRVNDHEVLTYTAVDRTDEHRLAELYTQQIPIAVLMNDGVGQEPRQVVIFVPGEPQLTDHELTRCLDKQCQICSHEVRTEVDKNSALTRIQTYYWWWPWMTKTVFLQSQVMDALYLNSVRTAAGVQQHLTRHFADICKWENNYVPQYATFAHVQMTRKTSAARRAYFAPTCVIPLKWLVYSAIAVILLLASTATYEYYHLTSHSDHAWARVPEPIHRPTGSPTPMPVVVATGFPELNTTGDEESNNTAHGMLMFGGVTKGLLAIPAEWAPDIDSESLACGGERGARHCVIKQSRFVMTFVYGLVLSLFVCLMVVARNCLHSHVTRAGLLRATFITFAMYGSVEVLRKMFLLVKAEPDRDERRRMEHTWSKMIKARHELANPWADHFPTCAHWGAPSDIRLADACWLRVDRIGHNFLTDYGVYTGPHPLVERAVLPMDDGEAGLAALGHRQLQWHAETATDAGRARFKRVAAFLRSLIGIDEMMSTEEWLENTKWSCHKKAMFLQCLRESGGFVEGRDRLRKAFIKVEAGIPTAKKAINERLVQAGTVEVNLALGPAVASAQKALKKILDGGVLPVLWAAVPLEQIEAFVTSALSLGNTHVVATDYTRYDSHQNDDMLAEEIEFVRSVLGDVSEEACLELAEQRFTRGVLTTKDGTRISYGYRGARRRSGDVNTSFGNSHNCICAIWSVLLRGCGDDFDLFRRVALGGDVMVMFNGDDAAMMMSTLGAELFDKGLAPRDGLDGFDEVGLPAVVERPADIGELIFLQRQILVGGNLTAPYVCMVPQLSRVLIKTFINLTGEQSWQYNITLASLQWQAVVDMFPGVPWLAACKEYVDTVKLRTTTRKAVDDDVLRKWTRERLYKPTPTQRPLEGELYEQWLALNNINNAMGWQFYFEFVDSMQHSTLGAPVGGDLMEMLAGQAPRDWTHAKDHNAASGMEARPADYRQLRALSLL